MGVSQDKEPVPASAKTDEHPVIPVVCKACCLLHGHALKFDGSEPRPLYIFSQVLVEKLAKPVDFIPSANQGVDLI